ncbi:hypothetical protein TcCL_Unassigned04193 [Trypanosoma cruzi]|nr:hypothetical protein TcCL_Unassigned04193 [Trypanosoma cruzi]
MGCHSRFRLSNESTGRALERGGCSQIVIFTETPPSCSGAVLLVEVPENNSESGSLVVRRRAANGFCLAVQSVAEVRSVCRPSFSSSLKWRVAVPVEFPAVPAHRGT